MRPLLHVSTPALAPNPWLSLRPACLFALLYRFLDA
jgi:hypothetical protein